MYVCFLYRHKQRQQEAIWDIEDGEEDEQLEALLGIPLASALGSVDKIHGEAMVLVIVFVLCLCCYLLRVVCVIAYSFLVCSFCLVHSLYFMIFCCA